MTCYRHVGFSGINDIKTSGLRPIDLEILYQVYRTLRSSLRKNITDQQTYLFRENCNIFVE